MIIKTLDMGMFSSNSYIVGKEGQGILIDAGVDTEIVTETVKELGMRIHYIILTHGHIDHICHVESIKRELSAKVLIHEKDKMTLLDPVLNGSAFYSTAQKFNRADRLLLDKETIIVGDLHFNVLHTPGHSPGGICIHVEDALFTGDTLFKMAIGRTDFENGDKVALMDSIMQKLMIMPDSTRIYPGHGSSTTVGLEKKQNPFIRRKI